MCRFALLSILAGLMGTYARAEGPVLLIRFVTRELRTPIKGIKVSCDTDVQLTDSEGRVRFSFPGMLPGEYVRVAVSSGEWVLISPLDGTWPLPNKPRSTDFFVARKGSPQAHPDAAAFSKLLANYIQGISVTAPYGKSKAKIPELTLDQLAESLARERGFDLAEIRKAFRLYMTMRAAHDPQIEAVLAQSEGDIGRAVTLSRRAIALLATENVDTYLVNAKLESEIGNFAGAGRSLSRVLLDAPEHVEALALLSLIGAYEKAISGWYAIPAEARCNCAGSVSANAGRAVDALLKQPRAPAEESKILATLKMAHMLSDPEAYVDEATVPELRRRIEARATALARAVSDQDLNIRLESFQFLSVALPPAEAEKMLNSLFEAALSARGERFSSRPILLITMADIESNRFKKAGALMEAREVARELGLLADQIEADLSLASLLRDEDGYYTQPSVFSFPFLLPVASIAQPENRLAEALKIADKLGDPKKLAEVRGELAKFQFSRSEFAEGLLNVGILLNGNTDSSRQMPWVIQVQRASIADTLARGAAGVSWSDDHLDPSVIDVVMRLSDLISQGVPVFNRERAGTALKNCGKYLQKIGRESQAQRLLTQAASL